MLRKHIRRPRSGFMLRLLGSFLVIIILMGSLVIVSLSFLQRYNEETLDYSDRMVQLQTLQDSLRWNAETVRNYYLYSQPEYEENFENGLIQIDNVLRGFEGITYEGADKYMYRDIRVMTTNYMSFAQSTFSRMQGGGTKIFVTADVVRIENLQRAIQSEIQKAISFYLVRTQALSSDTAEQVYRNRNVAYLLVLVAFLLCILFAWQFARNLSRPIISLKEKFELVAEGNLRVREELSVGRTDEIGILATSFNNMVEELEIAVEDIRHTAELELQLGEELLKNSEMTNTLQQAKLEFLQMQINPHFLFNTFNSISSLAMIENAPDTAEMIGHLSSLVRYTMSQIDNMVTLEEEFRIIEDYLFIQQVRFGSRLRYNISADSVDRSCIVPAMILQPIVENAIIHGIEPQEADGILNIRASCEGEMLEVIISDNGIGMSEEALFDLSTRLDAESDRRASESIGLVNVKQRLQILYGYNAMDIQSAPGKGTQVLIHLKKQLTPETKN